MKLLGPNVRKMKERGDIEGLVEALADRNPIVQQEAANALDELGLPDDPKAQAWHAIVKRDWARLEVLGVISVDPTVDLIDLVLKERLKDPKDKEMAVSALGRIGGTRAVEVLAEVLQRDPEVRVCAAAALVDMGSPAARAIIARVTKDQDLIKTTYLVLKEIGEPAVEPLVEVLKGLSREGLSREVDRNRVGVAMGALIEIGPPAVEQLISLLDSVTPLVRATAAHILGRIGDSRAVQPLAHVLNDASCQPEKRIGLAEVVSEAPDDPWLAAVDALRRIGQPAVEVLRAAEHEHEHPMVRFAAHLALHGGPAGRNRLGAGRRGEG